LVGLAIVRCPGCGEERWYGYGNCGRCGANLVGDEPVLNRAAVDLVRPPTKNCSNQGGES
jgi:hypothetical protein